MEKAVASTYYKGINTNSFSWTLNNIGTYYKFTEFLMFFVANYFLPYDNTVCSLVT